MRKLFVLLAAGAFLVAFTLPVIAAEWEFSGNSMFRTFIADDSEKSPGAVGGKSDDDLFWGRHVDTNIGATVSAGDITGRFMYRPLESSIHGNDFAQLYGSWNFGTGSLLIGKDLGPVNFFPSSQVYLDDMGLVGFGGILSYFKPLIQLTFGNLKIAALEPETPTATVMYWGVPNMQTSTSSAVTGDPFGDYDTSLPKLEVSYTFSAGPASLWVGGGYQTFDGVVVATDKDYGIDSYIVGLGWKIPIGALFINGNVFMGQNLGQYKTTFQIGNDDAVYDAASDSIKDTDSIGYVLVVGFKASDTITLEAGYGFLEHENDSTGTWEDDNTSYYVQAAISLAEGVEIRPEIGVVDYGDVQWGGAATKTDEGKTSYYGARWQITF